jgi:predicted O-methyltransferase YrrM
MPLTPTAQNILSKLLEDRKLTNTPNVSESTGMFLYNYIQEHQYRHVLELGTANGASTVYLLEAVMEREEAHVLSVEVTRAEYERAKKNLLPYKNHLTLVCSNATEFIDSLGDTKFDFIFIDAGKVLTRIHFEKSLRLLAPKGTIIVDDVVKFRHKMDDFYGYLESNDIAYSIEMTDPDDGILIYRNF